MFAVERLIRGKCAYGQCETLIQAPVLAHVIDKGIPTADLLAHIYGGHVRRPSAAVSPRENLWPCRADPGYRPQDNESNTCFSPVNPTEIRALNIVDFLLSRHWPLRIPRSTATSAADFGDEWRGEAKLIQKHCSSFA
jgi:hypothetical protein